MSAEKNDQEIASIWTRLETRIAELEAQLQQRTVDESSSRPSHVTHTTRRGMLRVAAGAAAAIAGAGALVERSASPVLAASATEGQTTFTSATTTPTVTVNNTSTGEALYGTTSGTGTSATAITGQLTSTTPGTGSAAVSGQNMGTNANGSGVLGTHAGSGAGVLGSSASGSGVYGDGPTGGFFTGTTNAIHGMGTNGGGGILISTDGGPAIRANSGGFTGVVAKVITNNGNGVVGESDRGPDSYGVWGRSLSGYGVYCTGNFAATGTKNAIVPFPDGTHHAVYCLESPECWFEDFGSAKLARGSVGVQIDPEFAHTVLLNEYHVFLNAEGDCNGLFVTDKSPAGFQVRELQGGTSSIPFSYRIVALRRDVKAPRLKEVNIKDPSIV